ncbi:peptidase inhibitor family I36 protein [Streptomyces sp. NPDC059629]|uniref:peptidase inhibitor family I36 protein n=1 Tax=Streptomyces sp. NPDC059629 TaxID=3346889 RepID=UPI00368ACD6B
MKRRFAMALGIAVAATGLMATGAQAEAKADTRVIHGAGAAACPSHYFCLYEHIDYNGSGSGRIVLTQSSVPDLRLYGFNDVASSVINNTADFVVVYKNVHYKGLQRAFTPSQRAGSLVGTGLNDGISSVRVF